jgi:hypothetical protein
LFQFHICFLDISLSRSWLSFYIFGCCTFKCLQQERSRERAWKIVTMSISFTLTPSPNCKLANPTVGNCNWCVCCLQCRFNKAIGVIQI